MDSSQISMDSSQISKAITAARRSLASVYAGRRPDRAAWKLADVAREVAEQADPITAGTITCTVARYEEALWHGYQKDRRELRNSSEELLALLDAWTASA